MTNSEGSATTAAQLSSAPTSAGSLPVEVLRLIFELAVEDDASDEMKERRSILRMTSLVCKAWRTAGQPLLAKGIRIDRRHLNDHDRLIGLFNAIEREQITSLDRMVVRLTGLPHAIRVCEKVGIVRKVDLIGIWFENGLDYLRQYKGRDFAPFDNFVSYLSGTAFFAGAESVRIEPEWWTEPSVIECVCRSLASSATTLKHLTIHPGIDFYPGLFDQLASLSTVVNLTTIRVINATGRTTSAVASAFSFAKLTVQLGHRLDSFFIHDDFRRGLDELTVELDQLHVVLTQTFPTAGTLLEWYLNATRPAKVKRIVVEQYWAQTFAMTRWWTAFAEQAHQAGVALTLLEPGATLVQSAVVFAQN